jgi:dTDP-4-amino-4,6-dideoxygalactose transaminase
MSEFNAALGLLQLKYVDRVIEKRGVVDQAYRKGLDGIRGINCLEDSRELLANYAYFPILVGEGYPVSRDQLQEKLKEGGIYARRYFYPLISEFPMYRELRSARHENLPIAIQAATQVLCLPIYPDLPLETVERICGVFRAL